MVKYYCYTRIHKCCFKPVYYMYVRVRFTRSYRFSDSVTLFIYLFIYLFIIYLQGLNHLLESRTFTFVMSSLTQNKMTTEFYEVSS